MLTGRYLAGACFCRSVRTSVEDDFEAAFYCHCSRCRRRTGSAFSAIGRIDARKVQVVAGGEHLLKLSKTEDQYACLCGRCHSQLYAVIGEHAHVSLGILSESPSRRPEFHIQVASKSTWYEILDDLPQYAEFPT